MGGKVYSVGLKHNGALMIRFVSTNNDSMEREAERRRTMGLEEGRHFTVRAPQRGNGYVYIRREGLAYVVWLSVHGSGEQRGLAAEFLENILQKAKKPAKRYTKRPER
jgi:hypothetical protein